MDPALIIRIQQLHRVGWIVFVGVETTLTAGRDSPGQFKLNVEQQVLTFPRADDLQIGV